MASGPLAGSPTRGSSTAPNTVRYKKTFEAAYTEYNVDTCAPISQGSWTVDPSHTPSRGTVSFGTVTGHLGNGDCPKNTYTFAAIYYTWTKHNNQKVTDYFDATWKTPDGQFNMPFVFNIEVPVVRPIGETSEFAGWRLGDARGNWEQTLKPPTDDPSFDFSGEQVRETHPSFTNTCNQNAVFLGASTPNSTPAPPWTVGSGNRWGTDLVGWTNCAVEAYRCIASTPCGYVQTQVMQIKSPVDQGWTPYVTNYLKGNVDGHAVKFLGVFAKDKPTIGTASSQRGDAAREDRSLPTNQFACPADARFSC